MVFSSPKSCPNRSERLCLGQRCFLRQLSASVQHLAHSHFDSLSSQGRAYAGLALQWSGFGFPAACCQNAGGDPRTTRDMQKREPSSPKTLIVYTSTCMYAACRCYILQSCSICLCACLSAYLSEWMAVWVDGWLDGWMDGWMDRCLYKHSRAEGLELGVFASIHTQTLVQQRSTSKSRLP